VILVARLARMRSRRDVPRDAWRGFPTDASYTGTDEWQLEVER
jgi:hypothetical protein